MGKRSPALAFRKEHRFERDNFEERLSRSFVDKCRPIPYNKAAVKRRPLYRERYRSGHNGADSKWSADVSVSSTSKSPIYGALRRFEKLNILLFCPAVLPSGILQNFRLTYTERYRSGHNGADSKFFVYLVVLSAGNP